MKKYLAELYAAQTAEQATGCTGAGNYMQYARQNGYSHIETLDWTSSAGDWDFLISKDGYNWHLLTQRNNYPRSGFTWAIDEGPNFGFEFAGTAEEVLAQAWEIFYNM